VTPLANDPTRRGILGRVAAWCYRRRRRVLLSWVILLIGATQMVLVPSVMELIGRWNWWIPRWLDRALPRVGIDHDDSGGGGGSRTRPTTAGDGSIDRAVHSAHE
jgi:hypothetical protein